MNDLISVIVPVYNLAEYLPHSIRSILKQSHANLEVIAVDDGSTDNSLRVLEEMAEDDNRIRVISQKNGGVTKARLTGAVAAKGEWVGFVDGDDEIEPDMYERLLQNALQYHADISHCGYQMVFPSRVDYYYNTGRLIQQDHRSGLKDLIEGSFIEPGLCNKLFHKRLLQSLLQSGKMDFSIKQLEDLLMNYYLFSESYCAVYEDFCPYHYMVRYGSASFSTIDEHKLMDPLRVLKTIKAESADDPQLQATVNRRIVGILISQSTMKIGNQTDLIKSCRIQARQELNQMLPLIQHGDYSKKMKLMTTWAAVWPESYSFMHTIYARLSGSDRKYEVS